MSQLDSGRLWRALQWQVNDYRNGIAVAATIGQIFGYGTLAFGAFQLLGGNIFNGVLLATIGLFLIRSASRNRKQAAEQAVLEKTSVGQAMVRQWHEVKGNMPVSNLVKEKIDAGGPSFYFVRRQNIFGSTNPHGIITLTDVGSLRKEQWGFTPVERLMTSWNELVTIDPTENLNAALLRMETSEVGQLPVVEDGMMVGTLSHANVMSYVKNN